MMLLNSLSHVAGMSPPGLKAPHSNRFGNAQTQTVQPVSAVQKKAALAPDFVLNDHEGKPVRLYDALEKGPVVLFFFPSNKTPFCQQQIQAFKKYNRYLTENDATVLGISADAEKSNQQFHEKESLPFSLLTDPNNVVRRAYGAQYDVGLPKRMTFVVAPRSGSTPPTIQTSFSSQSDIRSHMRTAYNGLQALCPPEKMIFSKGRQFSDLSVS